MLMSGMVFQTTSLLQASNSTASPDARSIQFARDSAYIRWSYQATWRFVRDGGSAQRGREGRVNGFAWTADPPDNSSLARVFRDQTVHELEAAPLFGMSGRCLASRGTASTVGDFYAHVTMVVRDTDL